MENFLNQTDSSKLPEKDFDKVLDSYEKFSKSVIFHDVEERKTKLFDMFKKMLKFEKPVNSRKRPIMKEKAEEMVKKQKLEPIEISKVPDEIWLKILNFMRSKAIFANFALACQKFHDLTLDSRAVKYLDLNEIKTSVQYQSAMKVLKKSKNLHEVTIQNCPKYCKFFIPQAFKSNPNLKSLNIGTQLNVGNWFDWPKNAKTVLYGKNLERLKIGSVLIYSRDEILTTILSLKNLKDLQVSLYDTTTGFQI